MDTSIGNINRNKAIKVVRAVVQKRAIPDGYSLGLGDCVSREDTDVQINLMRDGKTIVSWPVFQYPASDGTEIVKFVDDILYTIQEKSRG